MIGTRPLSQGELERLRDAFAGPYSRRNLTLFILGVNTGFRISELLSLTMADVSTKQGHVFNQITVRRQNTKGKERSRSIMLTPEAKRTIEYWVWQMREDGYTRMDFPLFVSRRGTRLSRQMAWKVLKDAYRAAGIEGRVGTHSMRKTFANRVYEHFLERMACGEKLDPFRLTSKALGHRRIDSTDAYLSFREEDINRTITRVGFG